MFAWFQRLLPQSGDFFALFERHGATLNAASAAMVGLTSGSGERATLIREVRDQEHAADEVIREVLHEVRQTFLTPFDRGAITSLIGAMDDTVDELHATSSAIELYEVTTFAPQMREMALLPCFPCAPPPPPRGVCGPSGGACAPRGSPRRGRGCPSGRPTAAACTS